MATADLDLVRSFDAQAKILERIATNAPLSETLDAIVELVEAQIPGCIGSLLLLDPETRRLHGASTRSLPAAYNAGIEGLAAGPNAGSCGTAAHTRMPVFVDEIATSPLWADYRELASAHGLRACWSTPILSRRRSPGDGVLGTFAVYFRTPTRATPAHRAALGRLEYLACIAIEADRSTRDLRESEARFRAWFDNAADALFVHDAATATVIDANATALASLGYSRDELIGASPLLFDPDFSVEKLDKLLTQLAGGASVTFESHHRSKNGVVFPVEIRIAPFDASGHRLNIADVRDITERVHFEERLRQAEKMEAVGRLAGGVAHDFNNLLTIVNGCSDLLLAQIPADSPLRSDLEAIAGAGQRAASLTSQLLAFGRKSIVETTIVDVNALIARLATFFAHTLGEDIELSLELAPGLSAIRADPGQIEQAVMNFVVNSRDAMPEGGRLTIATAAEPPASGRGEPGADPRSRIRVSVIDTGIGMSDETRARAFEPFFTTKQRGFGTGLGLASVYAVAKQLGGEIRLESEIGNGTRVHLLLPAVDERPPDLAAHEDDAIPRGSGRILLVEDEPGVRNLAARVLEAQGYRVVTAPDAATALALDASQAEPIDLLVTDVVLPGAGGRSLADQMRERHPGLQVLYISGYTDDEVVRRGVSAGDDAFLQKPFAPKALVRKVQSLL